MTPTTYKIKLIAKPILFLLVTVFSITPFWMFSRQSRLPYLLILAFVFALSKKNSQKFNLVTSLKLSSLVLFAAIVELFQTATFGYSNRFLLILIVLLPISILIIFQFQFGKILVINFIVFATVLMTTDYVLYRINSYTSGGVSELEIFRQNNNGPLMAKTPIINFTGGIRRTTDQQPTFENRILVFGGSTIFCGEVDDSQTVTSHLQRKLNQLDVNIRVENYGQVVVDAVYSYHQMTSLPKERLPKRGDIVVFYVGVNDAGSSFIYPNMIDRWAAYYNNYSSLVGFIDDHSVIQSNLFSLAGRGRMTAGDRTDEFLQALRDTKFVSESLGATFIPILQPTIYTKLNKSKYEVSLFATYGTDLEVALAEIYPKLATKLLSLPNSSDARDIFDQLQPSPFFDWMHVDSRGNELIASFIFEQIKPFVT